MSKLIEEYNQEDNFIVVSSYPEKGVKYSKKSCAVAGFAKNLIDQFKSQKVVVLTTKFGKKTEVYQDKKNLIIRFFRRNSPLSFLYLIYYLLFFNKAEKVLVQFEFASFGGTITSGLFILLPLVNKLLNKKTYFVFHQVLSETYELEYYFGWKKNDLKNLIFTPLLRLFYRIISFFSDQVVVLEQEFKQRLVNIGVKNDKIIVIPHGVDDSLKTFPMDAARARLHLPLHKKIILYFGYLTWYKGADIFVKMAKNDANKKNYYVLAGGPSFSQKNKSHYKKYLKQFKNLPKNITLIGFVPEKQIPLYFSACDLVILPYRSMISSSGPLSLAFSFEKPVILSKKLIPYLSSIDFQKNLRLAGLSSKDIFFNSTKENCLDKNQPALLRKLTQFSIVMKKTRSYKLLVNDYLRLINLHKKSKIFEYNHRYAAKNLEYN